MNFVHEKAIANQERNLEISQKIDSQQRNQNSFGNYLGEHGSNDFDDFRVFKTSLINNCIYHEKNSNSNFSSRNRLSSQDRRLSIQDRKLSSQDKKFSSLEKRTLSQGGRLSNQDGRVLNQNRLSNQDERLLSQNERLSSQGERLLNQDERLSNQDEKISIQDVRISNQERELLCQERDILSPERRVKSSSSLDKKRFSNLDKRKVLSLDKRISSQEKILTPERKIYDEVSILSSEKIKFTSETNALSSENKTYSSEVSSNSLRSPLSTNSHFLNLEKTVENVPSSSKTPNENSSFLNLNYTSPISPLYRKSDYSTPKQNQRQFTAKSWDRSGMQLGDFIVLKKSSSKKKPYKSFMESESPTDENTAITKKSRRINPTNLNFKKHEGFEKSDNSFNFQENSEELQDGKDQRNLLVEERLRILRRSSNGDVNKSSEKFNKLFYRAQSEIEPKFEFVTWKDELNLVATLFSFLLKNNLVLNVISEIYFLISLLINKKFCEVGNEEPDNLLSSDENFWDRRLRERNNTFSINNLFETIHNCCYFSAKVLESQKEIFWNLGRTCLRLLYENERFGKFTNLEHSSIVCDRKSDSLNDLNLDCVQTNVCYISDTDNRENFPNDSTFHSFRKQRDLFYEILRIWEQNHLLAGWNFSVALGGKIRSLLGVNSECSNLRHLARLFKGQLLASCSQSTLKVSSIYITKHI